MNALETTAMLDKIKAAGGTVNLIGGKPIALKLPVLRFKPIKVRDAASGWSDETESTMMHTRRYKWCYVLIGGCNDDARMHPMKIYAQ